MEKIKMVAQGLFEIPDGDLEQGYLIGSSCAKCRGISFPARKVCPFCLEREGQETTRLSGRGRLYTFSVNRQAPAGFTAPYLTGKVDLPEKVRLFGLITGVAPDENALAIGQEMEVVFGPVSRRADGQELIGYLFRPVLEKE